jgi:hypothetical protein
MLSRKDRPHEDVLDEVYLKYADSDPFMPITHFIDHSTMGAEALVALGLGHQVKEWISHHPVRSYQAPVTGISISADWRSALGRRECHGDFIKFFDAELSARSSQEVLSEWVPRFVHEVGAFLFHGLIRTAHATRALEHKDTPARRGELARGLSLWAIGVQSAPPQGLPPVSTPVAPSIDFIHFARVGAATFICDPNVPKLHLVTGAMAYTLIAPGLDEKTHQIAKASFDQTHLQVVEQFAARKKKAYQGPNVSLDSERLRALAAQRDAHPSKLTEAALRAYEESRDEIFLKAAARALDIHSVRALLGVAKSMITGRVA